MTERDDEERLLRSVALQNAQAILLARQRAEHALVEANRALELKSAELVESLAMMRATLESTTDGILVTDAAGTITGFNEKYLSMWRLPHALMSTATHHTVVEMVAEQLTDAPAFVQRVRSLYATSPPESYDLLEFTDGRVFERFSRPQAVDGRAVGRVWSFRDITDQRRAEQLLREQSERLSITLSSIGDAVVSTDADGVITFMNRVAETLTGWATEDAVGRPLTEVLDIVNHDTRGAVENPVLRALREGTVVGLAHHTVLIARDGVERPIDDSAAPIRDAAGAIVGAVLVFRDVSDRLQAYVTQGRLAAIVDSSQDVIISKSLDGTIRSWNREAERVFGYTADEAIGQRITLIIPADREDEEREIMVRLRRGERVEHFETVRRAKDGRLVDLSIAISPIRDRAGHVVGASKVARDISEQKKIGHALEASDRRKDEFLAVLAHELRNPLAPLANGLQVIRLAHANPVTVERARSMMERQLSHLVRLVDDLLDISRISRNSMELRRSRLFLSDIVNSAIETARPSIEAAGHTLTVSMPPEPIHLDGDFTRLSQVFSNLLTNSAKYTDPPGRIFLDVVRHPGTVGIAVRDTGIGIEAEQLQKIFGMFSQVDPRIERSRGGLGIGLALVDGLVRMHGGSVTAQSPGRGQGSTMTVTLPVVESAALPRTDTLESSLAAHHRRRILVVDDNIDAATSMAMMLELLGNEVSTAHDGLQAIERAHRDRPDVVLMDIGMPLMDGYEATRRIRSEPWGRDVMIIALTGWGQDEDRARSRESGCDGHVTKPVSMPDLEQLIEDLKSAPRT